MINKDLLLLSVTQMLLELRLPLFATVLLNGTTVFRRMWSSCFKSVVQFLVRLSLQFF